MDFLSALILTFTPLFVAIDPLGNVPVVLAIGQDLNRDQKKKIANIAVFTAVLVGLAFLLIGRFVLKLLYIEVFHFAIAGGLVLLALSIRDLATGKMIDIPLKEELIAVVPLGTPVTVGPATLTTLIVLTDTYNMWIVLLSFALNMAVTWVVFRESNTIGRFLGQGGLKAVSKVMSLLLAAIAVRVIIGGLKGLFPNL